MEKEQERIHRSKKNIKYGIILQTITILSNFIIRYFMLKNIGMVDLSLNVLFTEIIAFLSLTELGIGTIITYHLYQPLAVNAYERIGKLMNLFKKVYSLISVIILVIGLFVGYHIDFFLNGIQINTNYVRLVFFVYIIRSASSYLFAYNGLLLYADQKNHVAHKITIITRLMMTGISIFTIIVSRSLLAYILIEMLATIITNILTAKEVKRIYSHIPNNQSFTWQESINILKDVRNTIIGSISGKITNSTDNILISKIVSTVSVGYYSQYAMILNGISQIFNQIQNAIKGSIGNILVTEEPEYCDKTLKQMIKGILFPSLIFACGFCGCSTQFIQIIYGDGYELGNEVLLILSINFFYDSIKNPIWTMVQASGLFQKDKNISIIGSLANLALSIVLGIQFGMIGIFIGTLSSYIIQAELKIRLLYKEALRISPKSFLYTWYKMNILGYSMILFVFLVIPKLYICQTKSSLLNFIIAGFLSSIVPGICYLCWLAKTKAGGILYVEN